MVEFVDGVARSDWPIAGTRVVNDVRGRRSQMTEFGNRQQNIDEDDVRVSGFYMPCSLKLGPLCFFAITFPNMYR